MVGLARRAPSEGPGFREHGWLALVDLGLFAAVLIADHFHRIWFSEVPWLLAVAWASMALRGVRWRDVGLRLGEGWPKLVLIGLAAGVGMEGLELFVTQPLLAQATGVYPNLHEFARLVGNPKLLVLSIAFAWVVAGFGEELVFRGYLLNRLFGLAGGGRGGWAVALVVMSIVFGLKHLTQGVTRVSENVIAGLLLGGLYLATGRNLVAPIVAHALTDTIDFLIIYSGHYPGMH